MCGLYTRFYYGCYYTQVFKDFASQYRWVVGLNKKSDSYAAIEKVLLDMKARSGRNIRYVQTDGDGIFTAQDFERIRVKNSFVHQYAAPYDHNSNAKIEREIRTIFEGTATLLSQSGAPSNFWERAQKHFVFTKNVLPTIEMVEEIEKFLFLRENF